MLFYIKEISEDNLSKINIHACQLLIIKGQAEMIKTILKSQNSLYIVNNTRKIKLNIFLHIFFSRIFNKNFVPIFWILRIIVVFNLVRSQHITLGNEISFRNR